MVVGGAVAGGSGGGGEGEGASCVAGGGGDGERVRRYRPSYPNFHSRRWATYESLWYVLSSKDYHTSNKYENNT